MPAFLTPIHEHGDPDRPGPYPHAGGGREAKKQVRLTPTYRPDEVFALKLYRGDMDTDPPEMYLGGGFNGMLRGLPEIDYLNGPPHEIERSPAQVAYYQRQIASLTRAIHRTPTRRDQVFYRGVTAEMLPLLQEGTTFTDLGFTSVTADKTIADERFSGFSRLDDLNPGNKGRVYSIHIPKGTPLLDVDAALQISKDDVTEREFLLAPGTRFRVQRGTLTVLR